MSLIEKNDLGACTYVEPYAGGAGAALTILMLEKVDRIIINDLDKAIYSFWKAIIDDTEKFIRKIEKVDLSIVEWYRQKKIYKSKCNDIFKLGFATFYLNRTNRSGVIEGGPIGGTQQAGNFGIDARFNRETLVHRIRKIALYKKRIKITNKDGVALIKGLRNKEDVFAYLDPPYYVKGSLLYLNHYKQQNHNELAEVLNNNPNMNWILTYDNVPEIYQLYTDRKVFEFSINYHADIAKKGYELLILSDSMVMP